MGVHNPSLKIIQLDVLVYQALQYHFFTEYNFNGWFFSFFVKKSCIVKKTFLVIAQIGLTRIVKAYVKAYPNNAISDCGVKDHL